MEARRTARWTRRREVMALGLAVALHVSIVGVTRAVHVAPSADRGSAAPESVAELSTTSIDAPELAPSAASEPLSPSLLPASLSASSSPAASPAASPVALASLEDRRAVVGEAVLTAPEASAAALAAGMPTAPEPRDVWSFSTTRVATDVGAARFGSARVDGVDAPAEVAAAANGLAATNALLDGIAAHDIASGTSHGGPLLAAVEEAARQPDAPSLGVAVFDVTVSRNGAPQVSLVDAGDDARGWTKLGAAIAAATAKRQATVRLPENATAIRVRIRVEAVDRLADGTDVAATGKTSTDLHRGTLERTGDRADLPHAEIAHKGRICSVRAGIDPLAPYIDGSCSPENALPPVRRVAARILSETRL